MREERVRSVVLVVAAVLAAVVAVPASRAASPESQSRPPDVSYELALVRSPFPMLHVTVHCRPAASGRTEFAVDSGWSSVTDCENEIHGVGATDGMGKPLTVLTALRGARWTTASAPADASSTLAFAYYVVPTSPRLDWNSRKRPIVTASLLTCTGNVTLAVPAHLPSDRPLRIAVTWRGFAEAGWHVASSFSDDQRGFVVERPIAEFVLSSFIAGGDVRTVAAEHEGHRVAVTLAGSQWGFQDEALAELTARLAAAGSTFFGAAPLPRFHVGVVPVPEAKLDPTATAGVGLTDSMLLYLRPDEVLDWQPKRGRILAHVVMHEMLHRWLGGTLRPRQPTGYLIWFLEGFTDFLTRRLLLRSGVLTAEQFVDAWNDVMADYLHSPVRELPNKQVLANYHLRDDVRRLPYLRGSLVAAFVDDEIRGASGGATSLDDMLRAMVDEGRKDPAKVFGVDDVLRAVATVTSDEYAEDVRRWVVAGELLPLPPPSLEPDQTLDVRHVPDGELSRQARIATARRGGGRTADRSRLVPQFVLRKR